MERKYKPGDRVVFHTCGDITFDFRRVRVGKICTIVAYDHGYPDHKYTIEEARWIVRESETELEHVYYSPLYSALL